MKFKLWIKGRGRGLRETSINARSFDDVRKQANKWLEAGSEVTAVAPGGKKVTNFTIK